jgi:hypothetical protein
MTIRPCIRLIAMHASLVATRVRPTNMAMRLACTRLMSMAMRLACTKKHLTYTNSSYVQKRMSYIYEKCSYIHEYKNYSTTDVSIRLEAVLNGRVMQPPGDSGDSPTEGPEMLDLVEGLVGEGEHSLLTDFEINERIRNFRAKNYGGRTPGTLIWSADGEVRICENR